MRSIQRQTVYVKRKGIFKFKLIVLKFDGSANKII